MKHIKDSSVGYSTDLTPAQAILLKANLEDALSRQRKHAPEAIINAISYVLKTGCQWSMLPKDFPNWKTVYHHFRSLSERGWFSRFLRVLVEGQRASLGQFPEPFECIINSQSVRSALSDSQKGVDGNKRIKGIKRHIAVESNGYVLEVNATTANIHDSKELFHLFVRYCKIIWMSQLLKPILVMSRLKISFGTLMVFTLTVLSQISAHLISYQYREDG
ncbi:MAG: transposase [Muribaculaceae bacterium]|nr:transposase [Muribaculaceae bacterium]